MRAWLLLLAVLATFQTIVQVASTEDNNKISSSFITAIQPIKEKDFQYNATAKTTAIIKKSAPPPSSSSSLSTSTALIKLVDFTNTVNTEQELDKQTIVYKTHNKSDKISEKQQQQQQQQLVEQEQEKQQVQQDYQEINENINQINHNNNNNNNNKNIIIEIKNIEEEEEEEEEEREKEEIKEEKENVKAKEIRNVLENEVLEKNQQQQSKETVEQNKTYKNSVNFNANNNNNKSDKMIKNNKSNKMALNESELEQIQQQQHQQNQILEDQQQQQQNHIEEDTLNQNHKESSSSHPHHHHHHQQHHHHHHQQHKHQHQHQHQHHHHQQQNLQPASQQPQQHTTTSDNLPATAAVSSSSTSSSTSTSSSSHMDLDITVTENDDGAIVVESQQPQLDAVIPDEGPRTFSNQDVIAEKLEPDPSTLVQIESSLLSLFNMKRPPKIDRSKIIIPEAMKKLYAQIMGHEIKSVNIPKPGLLTKSANTVRSFTHQDSKIDDRFPHHHRFRLYFDIKSIPAVEKLKAAELQLTRDAISHATLNPRLANRTRYQVLVYDITRVGVRGKREPSYLLLDNKTIRLNSTETVSLDVQPAVDRWLATPKKNFGLLVEVRTSRSLKPAPHHHVRLRRSADEEHEHWQLKQPLLFTYTDDGRHKSRPIGDVNKRSKRAGGHHRRPHRRKNSQDDCRRHSLYVDFADVGWSDWIVAPPGYDAFYCSGRCAFPIADHLNSTNHAVVQTLVNSINPAKAPKACCVPTQLEGISMLYLNDHSTVVLKNYQDMSVVGCGCR